jgi:hypothetical protein
LGTTVTFTAAVGTSGAGTPGGTVSFLDGMSTLGTAAVTGGSASFSTSALSAGSHPISVVYGGDVNFNMASSGALTQVVVRHVPTLVSLSRTSAPEGATGLALVLGGTNFDASSQVRWNGLPLSTTFQSDAALQATVPSSDLAEEGGFAISVLNPGSDGGLSSTLAFTVLDAPLTPAASQIVAHEGTSFSGTIATFVDANPAALAGDFTASAAWGDGQSSLVTVTATGGGNFIVGGTHTYALDGRYSVLVTIVDVGGSETAITSIAHVARIGPPPDCLTIAARGFTLSTEYDIHLVTAAYQRFLGRLPETVGLAGWVNAIQSGLTDEQLEANLIGSPEYIANHGGLGTAWIRAMYQDLLNRTPADAEVSTWAVAILGGMATTDIAFAFTASPEREAIRVQADYQKYLGRPASQIEVAGWVAAFASHLETNEDIVAGIVGSAEYFQSHGDNIGDWIFGAYNDVLGRNPDDNGYAGWLAFLRSC